MAIRHSDSMTTANAFQPLPAPRPLPAWAHECACGFLYWLLFLLALEPDNLLRANQSGYPLALGHEVVRIAGASLLGASVTPILLALTRRFPVLGAERWRHALIHSLGAAGLSVALILASCLLAAWAFSGQSLPSLAELQVELVANGLLLVYALLAFVAIAHAVQFLQRTAAARAEIAPAPYLSRIPIKTRGRSSSLELANVDWIETQGNYLALHVGPAAHLVRESLVAFEAKLDPSRFVRIHRRAIVALDRIRDLQPVANGDATLGLIDGQELRVSRSYRKAVAEKWLERG